MIHSYTSEKLLFGAILKQWNNLCIYCNMLFLATGSNITLSLLIQLINTQNYNKRIKLSLRVSSFLSCSVCGTRI